MCVAWPHSQRVLTASRDGGSRLYLRITLYSPESQPPHPQSLLPGPRGERAAVIGDAAKAAAVMDTKTGAKENS